MRYYGRYGVHPEPIRPTYSRAGAVSPTDSRAGAVSPTDYGGIVGPSDFRGLGQGGGGAAVVGVLATTAIQAGLGAGVAHLAGGRAGSGALWGAGAGFALSALALGINAATTM